MLKDHTTKFHTYKVDYLLSQNLRKGLFFHLTLMMSSGLSLVRLQIFGRKPLLHTGDMEVDGRVRFAGRKGEWKMVLQCIMAFEGLGDLKIES